MIRGYLLPQQFPRVLAKIEFPDFTVATALWLLADTGAGKTIIHPRDFTLLGIPWEQLPKTHNSWGIGGYSANRIAKGIVSFQHLNSRVSAFEVDLWVAEPTNANELLPSILGWDILRFFRLYIDNGSNILYLLDEHDPHWELVEG